MTNLSLNDTGYYSCTVRNQYGGVVQTGWVEVGKQTNNKQTTRLRWANIKIR